MIRIATIADNVTQQKRHLLAEMCEKASGNGEELQSREYLSISGINTTFAINRLQTADRRQPFIAAQVINLCHK